LCQHGKQLYPHVDRLKRNKKSISEGKEKVEDAAIHRQEDLVAMIPGKRRLKEEDYHLKQPLGGGTG
jgi:hypothetical protein